MDRPTSSNTFQVRAPVNPEPHHSSASVANKNRLQFISRVGLGSRGQIFRATTKDNKTVAVKVLSRDDSDTSIEIAAFKRIQRHPYIVASQGKVDFTSETAFLVLEFCETDLLETILASEQRRLDEDTAALYFSQIVRAVQHCHSRNVFHLDLKPENVLLKTVGISRRKRRSMDNSRYSESDDTNDDKLSDSEESDFSGEDIREVRLCDFGSASLTRRSSRASGSVFYAAPEVLPLFYQHSEATPMVASSTLAQRYNRMLLRDGLASWNLHHGFPLTHTHIHSSNAEQSGSNNTVMQQSSGDVINDTNSPSSDDEFPHVGAHYEYDAAAADIWSLGVLLWVMLSGKTPFNEASTYDPAFVKLLRGKLEFPSYFSEPVKGLLRSILQPRAKSRPTLADIYRNSWVTPFDHLNSNPYVINPANLSSSKTSQKSSLRLQNQSDVPPVLDSLKMSSMTCVSRTGCLESSPSAFNPLCTERFADDINIAEQEKAMAISVLGRDQLRRIHRAFSRSHRTLSSNGSATSVANSPAVTLTNASASMGSSSDHVNPPEHSDKLKLTIPLGVHSVSAKSPISSARRRYMRNRAARAHSSSSDAASPAVLASRMSSSVEFQNPMSSHNSSPRAVLGSPMNIHGASVVSSTMKPPVPTSTPSATSTVYLNPSASPTVKLLDRSSIAPPLLQPPTPSVLPSSSASSASLGREGISQARSQFSDALRSLVPKVPPIRAPAPAVDVEGRLLFVSGSRSHVSSPAGFHPLIHTGSSSSLTPLVAGVSSAAEGSQTRPSDDSKSESPLETRLGALSLSLNTQPAPGVARGTPSWQGSLTPAVPIPSLSLVLSPGASPSFVHTPSMSSPGTTSTDYTTSSNGGTTSISNGTGGEQHLSIIVPGSSNSGKSGPAMLTSIGTLYEWFIVPPPLPVPSTTSRVLSYVRGAHGMQRGFDLTTESHVPTLRDTSTSDPLVPLPPVLRGRPNRRPHYEVAHRGLSMLRELRTRPGTELSFDPENMMVRPRSYSEDFELLSSAILPLQLSPVDNEHEYVSLTEEEEEEAEFPAGTGPINSHQSTLPDGNTLQALYQTKLAQQSSSILGESYSNSNSLSQSVREGDSQSNSFSRSESPSFTSSHPPSIASSNPQMYSPAGSLTPRTPYQGLSDSPNPRPPSEQTSTQDADSHGRRNSAVSVASSVHPGAPGGMTILKPQGLGNLSLAPRGGVFSPSKLRPLRSGESSPSGEPLSPTAIYHSHYGGSSAYRQGSRPSAVEAQLSPSSLQAAVTGVLSSSSTPHLHDAANAQKDVGASTPVAGSGAITGPQRPPGLAPLSLSIGRPAAASNQSEHKSSAEDIGTSGSQSGQHPQLQHTSSGSPLVVRPFEGPGGSTAPSGTYYHGKSTPYVESSGYQSLSSSGSPSASQSTFPKTGVSLTLSNSHSGSLSLSQPPPTPLDGPAGVSSGSVILQGDSDSMSFSDLSPTTSPAVTGPSSYLPFSAAAVTSAMQTSSNRPNGLEITPNGFSTGAPVPAGHLPISKNPLAPVGLLPLSLRGSSSASHPLQHSQAGAATGLGGVYPIHEVADESQSTMALSQGRSHSGPLSHLTGLSQASSVSHSRSDAQPNVDNSLNNLGNSSGVGGGGLGLRISAHPGSNPASHASASDPVDRFNSNLDLDVSSYDELDLESLPDEMDDVRSRASSRSRSHSRSYHTDGSGKSRVKSRSRRSRGSDSSGSSHGHFVFNNIVFGADGLPATTKYSNPGGSNQPYSVNSQPQSQQSSTEYSVSASNSGVSSAAPVRSDVAKTLVDTTLIKSSSDAGLEQGVHSGSLGPVGAVFVAQAESQKKHVEEQQRLDGIIEGALLDHSDLESLSSASAFERSDVVSAPTAAIHASHHTATSAAALNSSTMNGAQDTRNNGNCFAFTANGRHLLAPFSGEALGLCPHGKRASTQVGHRSFSEARLRSRPHSENDSPIADFSPSLSQSQTYSQEDDDKNSNFSNFADSMFSGAFSECKECARLLPSHPLAAGTNRPGLGGAVAAVPLARKALAAGGLDSVPKQLPKRLDSDKSSLSENDNDLHTYPQGRAQGSTDKSESQFSDFDSDNCSDISATYREDYYSDAFGGFSAAASPASSTMPTPPSAGSSADLVKMLISPASESKRSERGTSEVLTSASLPLGAPSSGNIITGILGNAANAASGSSQQHAEGAVNQVTNLKKPVNKSQNFGMLFQPTGRGGILFDSEEGSHDSFTASDSHQDESSYTSSSEVEE